MPVFVSEIEIIKQISLCTYPDIDYQLVVEQLRSPADKRRVRDITLVGFNQFSPMIGVVFGDQTNLNLVEVIGGNHTREALKRLAFKGKVSVRLYHNVTDEECLVIGFKHNKKHEFWKGISLLR